MNTNEYLYYNGVMKMTNDLISKKDLIEALGDENFLKYAEQEQLFLFASEGDLLAIVGGIKDLISSAPVVNSEAIARVVYDTWKDEKGVIYRKDRPQIWSLVKDDVLLALEEDAKLFTAPPQPQASRDALEKQGLAIVPMRLTKEMKAIFSEEEWEWKDLLAAAEAITEQQYSALIEHDAPSAPTNLKIRRSEL